MLRRRLYLVQLIAEYNLRENKFKKGIVMNDQVDQVAVRETYAKPAHPGAVEAVSSEAAKKQEAAQELAAEVKMSAEQA
jgi:hypothetical protein